mmetsp:Transcript_7852/g.15882  ORF Transcript_7852/g.15882 Transcript_7852/m.15882 type:complete len:215 (-) Transcript_7852:385-1029(-)
MTQHKIRYNREYAVSQERSHSHSSKSICQATFCLSLSSMEAASRNLYRLSSSARREYTASTTERSRGRIILWKFLPCCVAGSSSEIRLTVMLISRQFSAFVVDFLVPSAPPSVELCFNSFIANLAPFSFSSHSTVLLVPLVVPFGQSASGSNSSTTFFISNVSAFSSVASSQGTASFFSAYISSLSCTVSFTTLSSSSSSTTTFLRRFFSVRNT